MSKRSLPGGYVCHDFDNMSASFLKLVYSKSTELSLFLMSKQRGKRYISITATDLILMSASQCNSILFNPYSLRKIYYFKSRSQDF